MNAHNARRTSLPARSRSATFHAPPPARRRTGAISRAPAAISPHPPPPPPPPLPRRRRRLPCRSPEYRGGGLASASKKGRWPPPRMPRSCGHRARAAADNTLTASAIVVNEATHFHPRGVSFIRLSNGHRAPQVLYPPPHTSQAPSLPRLQTLWQQPARGLGWS
jgi:hypothetical protein